MERIYSDWYTPLAPTHYIHTHIHTHTHAHTSTRTHRPDDSLATRIPCGDVGLFPPNGGTRDYIDAKASVDDLDDWFEYHTDFLPEKLVITLNSGLGGYVSQRRLMKMPLAAPKTNDECIDRLCDLLTTSCPETHLLLQRNIDLAVIGTYIRSFVCVRVCVCARVCASALPHTYTCRKKFSGDWFHGKVLSRSIDGLAIDAKPRYYVKYEDDDEEELYIE